MVEADIPVTVQVVVLGRGKKGDVGRRRKQEENLEPNNRRVHVLSGKK